jgi:hypothetical protein
MSHSEASQEANEAATHLTEALTAAASTRDTLSEQLKVSQTKLREKTSSLRNLQLALEGFQKQVCKGRWQSYQFSNTQQKKYLSVRTYLE